MRSFIAIPLPESVQKEISRIQSRMYLKKVKVKLVKDPHITLSFLGNIDENTKEKIINALKYLDFSSTKISLQSIDGFPDMRHAKVVWVKLTGEEFIKELEQKIRTIIRPFCRTEERKFVPHVTIARVKFVKDKKTFMDMLQNIKVKKESFLVDEVALFKSTLTSKGAEYEKIFSIKK